MSTTTTDQQPKSKKHRFNFRKKTSDELADEWAEKSVELPRMPFFYINIYQFCMPIFVLIGINFFIYYLYELLSVQIIWQIIFLPLLFIIDYFMYIWSMTKFCKLLHWYYNKKSPASTGVFSRKFTKHNVADRSVHYYHLRGFLYKWPVFISKKSIFPWMVNFVLRDMAANKIDKDVIYGDAYVSLEFTDLQQGAVIMDGATLSSHVNDSIFGNLTIEEVTVEKNGVMQTNSIMAPGGTISEGTAIGPKTYVPKGWRIEREDSKFIYGSPAKKYRKTSFIELLPNNYKMQWLEKQKKFKNN